MKLPISSPSFSSRSSSCNSTAFDATMCSSKSATSGCISGILRRILCKGSFPTYPSDHILGEEENSVESSSRDQDFNAKDKTEISASPSIVARLMGLDSIPDRNLVSSQSTQNSISRSKSMNSVDRFDKHRGMKSTRSFREMPTFLELENEEFFILSFESERKSKETESKGRKCEKRRSQKTENTENRRERRAENKKQLQEGQSRRALNDLNGKEMLKSRSTSGEDSKSTSIATKTIKKKKTICDVLKNGESEFSSEDLSPVSVLNCGQFLVDTEIPSSEKDSSVANSCKENGPDGDARRKKTREGKCLGSKKEFHRAKHIGMWNEICRLTQAELVGSNWIIQNKGMWSFEGISAGIGADFESQILGQLLDEIVDQFADLAMEIQNLQDLQPL